jgi:hypothetical protein
MLKRSDAQKLLLVANGSLLVSVASRFPTTIINPGSLPNSLQSLACGLCAMGMYIVTDPHLEDMYGSHDISQLCHWIIGIGVCLLLVSIGGCHVIQKGSKLALQLYIGLLVSMVVVHVGAAFKVYDMTSSDVLDTCIAGSQAACTAFQSTKMHLASYFLWQQIWAEAMKPKPDVSAQAVLQYVQDEGKCCGFGHRKTCVADLTKATWLASRREPKQQCSVDVPDEYCYNVASTSGSYHARCHIKSEWDFPYGTYDGCQEKNQKSGQGYVPVPMSPVCGPTVLLHTAVGSHGSVPFHARTHMRERCVDSHRTWASRLPARWPSDRRCAPVMTCHASNKQQAVHLS